MSVALLGAGMLISFLVYSFFAKHEQK